MPQVSATVTPETYEKIRQVQEKESRSLSNTVEVLLERALKERERKNKKRVHDKQN